MLVRIFLATVLLVSGLSKQADLAGSRRSHFELGGPYRLAGFGARFLPVLELLLAVGLLVPHSSWVASTGAFWMFVVFCVVILVNLLLGNRPSCNCFGKLTSSPLSWLTFARTTAFAAAAGYLVAQEPSEKGQILLSQLPLVSATGILIAGGVGALGLIAIASTVLLRRHLRKKERDSPRAHLAAGPGKSAPIGTPVPGLAPAERPALLLATVASSPTTAALLDRVESWRAQLGGAVDVTTIEQGDDNENLLKAIRVSWFPAAALVSAGRVASPVVYGTQDIEVLVGKVVDASNDGLLDRRALYEALEISVGQGDLAFGEPAPPFETLDRSAETVSASTLLGESSVVLFCRPTCGFCKALAEDLQRFEAQTPADAPRLVYITSGELEAAKTYQSQFTSLSFYDPENEVGKLFGITGTPSAVLLDAEGRVASTIAVGAEDIWSLLGGRPGSNDG